ncbi:MAG: ribosomal protein S18-alanine N-acetyltransferase [Clostridia bacterium]|nr:ribosomal protein S18-alanine N-acetyltransferase [Clostridia bacterium]
MSESIKLSTEHLRSVAALERLCFAEPWSETSLEVLCREHGLGAVVPGENESAAAKAYAGMTWVLDEGSITNVAVRPDMRRQGLGRAVVEALIEQASEVGVTDVYLEVRVSNEAAISLYRSLGFCIVGTRKAFYKCPTEDAHIMHRHEDLSQ